MPIKQPAKPVIASKLERPIVDEVSTLIEGGSTPTEARAHLIGQLGESARIDQLLILAQQEAEKRQRIATAQEESAKSEEKLAKLGYATNPTSSASKHPGTVLVSMLLVGAGLVAAFIFVVLLFPVWTHFVPIILVGGGVALYKSA